MTVAKLIEQLKTVPGDLDVVCTGRLDYNYELIGKVEVRALGSDDVLDGDDSSPEFHGKREFVCITGNAY